MRKHDSSVYRVKPMMDKIVEHPAEFIKKIFGVEVGTEELKIFYGEKEKKLEPPKEFLIKLLEKQKEEAILITHKNEKISEERKPIYNRDAATIDSIIDWIKSPSYKHSSNYRIFEGKTSPDVFIEGDNYIIICEGKWTEKDVTLRTSRLNHRSQMIRHIQGAINYNSKKTIYAYYIVDEEFKNKEKRLSKEALIAQLNNEDVKLEELEQKVIDSFHGFITWQKISEETGIEFETIEEIDKKTLD